MIKLKISILFLIQVVNIISVPLELDMEVKTVSYNMTYNTNKTNVTLPYKLKSSLPEDLIVLKQDLLTIKACLGIPYTCFNLIYDTGSYNLWVPSIYSQGCIGCTRFDENYSKSFIKDKEANSVIIQYLSGVASGHFGSDLIKLGDIERNLTIGFMVADKISFNVQGADGIIGFGRNYETNKLPYKMTNNFSIMEILMKRGMIIRKVFSQKYLNKEKTQAKLYIGDYHEDFANNKYTTQCRIFHKDPLFARYLVGDLWTCRMSYIIIGNNKIENFDMNSHKVYQRAVIDSGSNYIMAPFSNIYIFEKIFETYSQCSLQKDYFTGISMFICESYFDIYQLPKISFVLNGIAYNIPIQNLFINQSERGFKKLSFSIYFMDTMDYWLLGQAFMKNFHILFDHEKDLVKFSPLDIMDVTDVTMKTTDDDFVIWDYLFYIIIGLSVLVIVTSILIYVCCKKRRSEVVSTYSLFNENNMSDFQYQTHANQMYRNANRNQNYYQNSNPNLIMDMSDNSSQYGRNQNLPPNIVNINNY